MPPQERGGITGPRAVKGKLNLWLISPAPKTPRAALGAFLWKNPSKTGEKGVGMGKAAID